MMIAVDLPPKMEIVHDVAPRQDEFALHIDDIAHLLGPTPTPDDLIALFMNDDPDFPLQFYHYITSDTMKSQMIDGFDRDQYVRYMEQYFIKMNEDNIPWQQLPMPLRKGYEDMFRAGAGNAAFQGHIKKLLLLESAVLDKKTGKLRGVLGHDNGGGFTAQILKLLIELYNTTFVTPTPSPTPSSPSKPVVSRA